MGSPWPCDFGPDLSRGFRALKTWFTLKVYGTAQLGAVMSQTCTLAQYLKRIVEETPQLELAAPVPLNIVCFRYRCGEADTVNAEIVADLQESGIAVPSTTTIDGRLAIRAAIVNHRTQSRDIDARLAAVLHFGEKRAKPAAAPERGFAPLGTPGGSLHERNRKEPSAHLRPPGMAAQGKVGAPSSERRRSRLRAYCGVGPSVTCRRSFGRSHLA